MQLMVTIQPWLFIIHDITINTVYAQFAIPKAEYRKKSAFTGIELGTRPRSRKIDTLNCSAMAMLVTLCFDSLAIRHRSKHKNNSSHYRCAPGFNGQHIQTESTHLFKFNLFYSEGLFQVILFMLQILFLLYRIIFRDIFKPKYYFHFILTFNKFLPS